MTQEVKGGVDEEEHRALQYRVKAQLAAIEELRREVQVEREKAEKAEKGRMATIKFKDREIEALEAEL